MKFRITLLKITCLTVCLIGCQIKSCNILSQETPPGKIQSFADSLDSYILNTSNKWFRLHCQSILRMIHSKTLISLEAGYLGKMYDAFTDTADPFCAADVNTYLQRRRPLIFSWTSASDGSVSLSWLKLPRNYQPGKKYPLYVELHGLWNVASNAFQYMSYPFTQGPSYNNAFEDGFLLSPWGRGNYWYQGSSETDIWECMNAFMNIAGIDSSRVYLCGHSMGGYGAMCIAGKSPDNWAAVGIYAGALWYNPSPVNSTFLNSLKEVPVYFICGTGDDLIDINREAYNMLDRAGNKDLCFNTFNGSHVYREGDVFAMYMWMRQYTNDDIITQTKNEVGEEFSYTNPAGSVMNIKYPKVPGRCTRFNIYDLSGELIYTFSDFSADNDGLFTISLNDLTSGAYILNVIQENKAVSGVFVKL